VAYLKLGFDGFDITGLVDDKPVLSTTHTLYLPVWNGWVDGRWGREEAWHAEFW
jgi:hypothetical protein